MSEINVTGECDPKFSEIQDIFQEAVSSGFDTGANIAIEHQGKMVVNLIGGYKDREGTDPWTNKTILNVFSTSLKKSLFKLIKIFGGTSLSE